MKLFSTIFILLLLASCGTVGNYGHLSYVKVDHKETPVIDKTNKEIKQESNLEETAYLANEKESVVLSTPQEEDLRVQTETKPKIQIQKELEDLTPDDDEDLNAQIVDQAIRAERDARTTVGLFGAGLISILLPYIGIIFFIIGLVFYSKAKNSRYITPYGEDKLNVSRTLLIIDSVILSLWLLLFLFILIILF